MTKDHIRKICGSWRWRRVKAGMVLKDMSELTGITIANLSNYENGKATPMQDNFNKVEKALVDRDV